MPHDAIRPDSRPVESHFLTRLIRRMVSGPNLSKNLILIILLINGVASIVVTITTLYLDYQNEKSRIHESVSLIEKNNVQSVSLAIWNYDQRMIRIQLEGLLHFRYLRHAAIIEGGVKIADAGDPNLDHFHEFQFPLIHSQEQSSQNLGILVLRFDNTEMFQDLAIKTLIVFLSQAFKALIVSLVLFSVFQWLLVSPITRFSSLVQAFQSGENQPIVPFRTNSEDELSQLFQAVSQMSHRIITGHQKLSSLNENLEKLATERAEIITKQERVLAEEARLASIGRVAGGIAHEINTPLGIATLRLERLKKNDFGANATTIQNDILKLEMALDRISQIIANMRLLNRDSSKEELHEFDPLTVLEHVISLCSEKARVAQIDLEFTSNLKPEQHCIARPTQLGQVLINLVSNAMDAAEQLPQKWVKVHVSSHDQEIHISVIDAGSGVPPEIRSRMFDPYFTTKEVGKGTGLGLSLSKTMMEQMAGSLSIDESAANTTFIVKIAAS